MIKTILGYDIAPGVSVEEYERWLFEVHVSDIMANPYVDRLLFNKILRPVTKTSGGTSAGENNLQFYRIAEMHFADDASYAKYLAWFEDHPVPVERSPAGRTEFRFYLVTDVTEVDRSTPLGPSFLDGVG